MAGESGLETTSGASEGLRQKLSPLCLVLYDRQRRLLALKWRPNAFLPQPQTAGPSSRRASFVFLKISLKLL